MRNYIKLERFLEILGSVNQRIIKKIIVTPMSTGSVEPDTLMFTIGTRKYHLDISGIDPRHNIDFKNYVINFIDQWNIVDTNIPITKFPKEDRFDFEIIEQSRLRTYEFKIFHQSTTVDKVWVQVDARNPEEAKQIINDGNGDWIDSKQIDTIDGEYIDEDEWTYTIKDKNGTL